MVLAGSVGFFFLSERITRASRVYFAAVVGFSVLAVCINVAAASTMQPTWSSVQAANLTKTQLDVSGPSLDGQVAVSTSLPLEAPPGHVVIIGKCRGLFRTLGPQPDITLSILEHGNWFALSPTVGATATLHVTFLKTPTRSDPEVVFATRGQLRLVLRPVGHGSARIITENPVSQIPEVPTSSPPFRATQGTTGVIKVTIDPYLQRTSISGFDNRLPATLTGPGVTKYPAVHASWVRVKTTRPFVVSDLCRQILKLKH